MNESAARVLFFGHIAAFLVSSFPGHLTNFIALRIDGRMDLADRLSLAQAVGRECAHEEPYSVVDAKGATLTDVASSRHEKVSQRVIVFNYKPGPCGQVSELVFNTELDTDCLYQAAVELFGYCRVEFDGLALFRLTSKGFRAMGESFGLFESPSSLWEDAERLERWCHGVSAAWVYQGERVSGTAVYEWVQQFVGEDFDYRKEACSLLYHLKREGFVALSKLASDIRLHVLEHLHTTSRQYRFVAMQPEGKSEHLISYALHPMGAYLSANEAIDVAQREEGAVHLLCADDVIVSGQTFIKAFFDTEFAAQWERLFTERGLTVDVFVAYADSRGVHNVETFSKFNGRARVHANRVLTDADRVFALGSTAFCAPAGHPFEGFCHKIGKRINRGNPLGWSNAQWCLVFDYSVPNGTLPILWASSSKLSWMPLFPRKRTAPRAASSPSIGERGAERA